MRQATAQSALWRGGGFKVLLHKRMGTCTSVSHRRTGVFPGTYHLDCVGGVLQSAREKLYHHLTVQDGAPADIQTETVERIEMAVPQKHC